MTPQERNVMKQALEALETLTQYNMVRANIFRRFEPTCTGDYVDLREFRDKAKPVITAIKEALAQQSAERVSNEQVEPRASKKLRRGDILRCIETDELCVVWATSTTGKTLVKWGGNQFGEYTAKQIGELFWLEPESHELEIAAEQSDNYAAFHAGYRFAVAHPPVPTAQPKPLTDEKISLIAHNIDSNDWNDLKFKECWHEGFKAGFREAEIEHNIKG